MYPVYCNKQRKQDNKVCSTILTTALATIFRSSRSAGNMSSYFLAITTLAITISLSPVQYATSQEITDETFTLNLKNVDIHSLIETVSIRTGRNFIIDPRVKATVNVISSEPVNADKLYEIFLSVLEVHGYAAVQAGQITKIVPSTVGVQSAIPLLGESSGTADELVSQVIHLQRIPAVTVIEAMRPLLPQSASISAESNSNAVVVTDRAANIKKIIELIILMDAG